MTLHPKPTWSSTVAAERLDSCPNCGTTAVVFWVNGRDRLLGVTYDIFSYSKCRECGVLFQSIRPVQSIISRFYTDYYQPHGVSRTAKESHPKSLAGRLDGIAMRLAQRISGAQAFRDELNRFYKKAFEQKPLLLDFGCGGVKFLDRARKKGCGTIGMDFSPPVLAEIGSRGHRALGVKDTDWDKIEPNTLGLVRMNHVIEHLYEPACILQRIHGKMAPGAVIHLATPNAESLGAQTYREHWLGLDCPRHIIIFSPSALENLLNRAGFRKIQIVHEPVTKDLARSAIFRDIDAGREPMQDVQALADDGLLNLRFALAGRLAALRTRSDRIHAFGVK